MVVKFLENYIKETPGLMEDTNIKDLIARERERDPNTKPTVLLDASSAFFFLYPACDLRFCCNFQPKLLKRNIEKFVEAVTSCGADLIVVLRGNNFKIDHLWFSRNLRTFNHTQTFFYENTVRENIPSETVLNIHNAVFTYCTALIFSIIENDNYTVVLSENISHQFVASIAKSHNCFAVIGQNSNYVIYNCISTYIDLKSVNFETLDCKIYNKNQLCTHLNIKTYQLPLFASLCGNDIIDECMLRPFHERISENTMHPKFLAIADFVRDTTDDPYKDLQRISSLVGIENLSVFLLDASLDMYLKEPEKEVGPDFTHLLVKMKENLSETSRLLSSVLVLQEFKMKPIIENFKDSYVIPIVKLLAPLRQKIYGIILHDQNYPKVKEYFLTDSDSRTFKPFLVNPIRPEAKHPGLVFLWTSPKTVENNRIRWDLICTTVSRTLNHGTLSRVPTKLLIPVLALHYLASELNLFEVFRNKFEVEALLVTVIRVYGNVDEHDFEQCHPNYRALHLSNYFIHCCHLMEILNQVCGFVISKEDSGLWNYYDGALFQYVYKELKKDKDWKKHLNGNVSLEKTFCALLEIIYDEIND